MRNTWMKAAKEKRKNLLKRTYRKKICGYEKIKTSAEWYKIVFIFRRCRRRLWKSLREKNEILSRDVEKENRNGKNNESKREFGVKFS